MWVTPHTTNTFKIKIIGVTRTPRRHQARAHLSTKQIFIVTKNKDSETALTKRVLIMHKDSLKVPGSLYAQNGKRQPGRPYVWDATGDAAGDEKCRTGHKREGIRKN